VARSIRSCVAMLAAVGDRRPKFIMPQMEQGHAYAAWSWS